MSMTMKDVVAQIDAEIARLEQARSLLAATALSEPGRGVRAGKGKKKRKLSPEGRARIAEAARRRWAAQKGKRQG